MCIVGCQEQHCKAAILCRVVALEPGLTFCALFDYKMELNPSGGPISCSKRAVVLCRVIAWEPVPTFRTFLEYGVELNRLGALVEVRAAAVGDKEGAEYELVVPQRGIWGTASIDGRNIDKCAACQCHISGCWPRLDLSEGRSGCFRIQVSIGQCRVLQHCTCKQPLPHITPLVSIAYASPCSSMDPVSGLLLNQDGQSAHP